jgi:phosphatidylinositol-bisphosphatase
MMTCHVQADNEAARALDAILVLHLEHGQDFFVTLAGTYEPSAFGAALEWLTTRHAPVRVPAAAGGGSGGGSSGSGGGSSSSSSARTPLLVPRELWLLLERVQRAHGLRVSALFRERGDATEKAELRNWLDARTDFLGQCAVCVLLCVCRACALTARAELSVPVSVHSVAETLLEWLGALWPPVIPFEHYGDALEGAHDAARSRLLVAHVSPTHYRTFHYVAAFLRACVAARVAAADAHATADDETGTAGADASTSERERREQQHLAALFAPLLVRPAAPARASVSARRRAALFVSHFVVADE